MTRTRGTAIGEGASPDRSQRAHKRKDYQASYDLVADEYVRRIFGELQHKPLDRQLLDRFAASVRPSARRATWDAVPDTLLVTCTSVALTSVASTCPRPWWSERVG